MTSLRRYLAWLLFASIACLASVPGVCAQSDDAAEKSTRVGISSSGLRGLVHTGVPVQRFELNASATGGYGYTESIDPVAGAHHRAIGTLGAALAPLPWLAVALRFDGRLDIHPDDGNGPHGAAVGDPHLIGRVGTWLGDEIALGAELGLWFPGNDAPSFTPSATTASLKSLFTYAPQQSPITLLGALGFRLDQSASSAPDLARLTFGDRLALGLADSHAVLAALGLAYRVDSDLELFGELSADLLVGGQAPSLAQSPLRAAVGGRYAFSSWLAFELTTITSLSSRPTIAVTDPLVPIEPRVSVLLGLRISFGLDEPKEEFVPPDEPEPEPEPVAPVEVVEEKPPAPTHRSVTGTLTDQDGAPLPEVGVRLTDAEGAAHETITDADGHYHFDEVAIGPASIEVTAIGFEAQRWDLAIGEGEAPEAPRALNPKTTSGVLRGLVRSFTSEPLVAEVLVRDARGREVQRIESDAEGHFELELPPGRYRVTIEAPSYRPHTRTMKIAANNVAILNVDLKEAR